MYQLILFYQVMYFTLSLSLSVQSRRPWHHLPLTNGAYQRFVHDVQFLHELLPRQTIVFVPRSITVVSSALFYSFNTYLSASLNILSTCLSFVNVPLLFKILAYSSREIFPSLSVSAWLKATNSSSWADLSLK